MTAVFGTVMTVFDGVIVAVWSRLLWSSLVCCCACVGMFWLYFRVLWLCLMGCDCLRCICCGCV